jgi:peroxiredoxin
MSRAWLAARGLVVAAVAFLLVVLVWRVGHSSGGVAAELGGGKQPVAPAFSLERLNGPGTVKLSDYAGRVVVLSFFASWCGPCKSEAPGLERSWQRWQDDLVSFVGINVRDFRKDARAFAKHYGLTFPVVRDGSEQTTQLYGVDGLPSTFVVSPGGRVVAHFAGEVSEVDVDAAVERALRAAGAD